jgi:hypothetical protein
VKESYRIALLHCFMIPPTHQIISSTKLYPTFSLLLFPLVAFQANERAIVGTLTVTLFYFVYRNLRYLVSTPESRLEQKEEASQLGLVYLIDEKGLVPQDLYVQHPIMAFAFHIIPSLIWTILALLQFNKSIRNQYRRLHRISGYVFLMLSVSLAISGMGFIVYDMAYKHSLERELSTPSLTVITFVMSLWFLITALYALKYAREKKIKQHENWIIRHSATGYSVITMRLILGTVAIIHKGLQIDDSSLSVEYKKDWFNFAMWLGVAVSLPVAEVIIKQRGAVGTGNKTE